MPDSAWFWWALLSMMSWGLWGVFSAFAGQHGTARGVLAAALLMEAMFVVPLIAEVPRSWSWWIVGVGASGALAYGAMFKALETGGPGGNVIGLTSLYPVITVLVLAALGAGLTWRQLLGVALAVIAGLLLIEP